MNVSREEIIHIAKLADLDIKDEELEKYQINLQDILNFANIIDKAPIQNLDDMVIGTEEVNVFRKDEIKEFEDKEALLNNSKHIQNHMFQIPKVID